jgi:hypothetical protein
MLNTKCGYCGTVAQAAELNCEVCGGALVVRSSFDRDALAPEWQPLVDPDQPPPGIAPFTVETAISETLSLFFRNLWQITKIVAVVVAPFEIVMALNAGDVGSQWEVTAWSYLLGAACKVLVAAPLIYSLLKLLQTGEPAGIHESYRWGLTKLVKLSICALIFTVIQGLGYALCIIPGIIVSLSLAVVYPVAVLEGGSVSEIFRRSSDLTRGHRLEIFGVYLLLGILMLIVAGVSGFVIGTVNLLPVTVVGSILVDVSEHLFTVLSLVLYLGLSRSPEASNYTVLSLNK